MTNEDKTIVNLESFEGDPNVRLPRRGSALTYKYTWDNVVISENNPASIEIAPVINGDTCGVSDTLPQLDKCPPSS